MILVILKVLYISLFRRRSHEQNRNKAAQPTKKPMHISAFGAVVPNLISHLFPPSMYVNRRKCHRCLGIGDKKSKYTLKSGLCRHSQ